MANKRNEIVEPETDRIRRADCFLYCNIPNTPDQNLSKFDQSENCKFLHKILDDLMHSTAQMIKNKQVDFNIKDLNISTSCKPEDNISTCISSTSIGKSAIERSAKIVDVIKQRTIDAIASNARLREDFDKAWRENLSRVVKNFVREVSLRYAKYMNNAVSERGPHCISIGTQSDIVNEKFSSETSLDTFTKACEERRHADFILQEIAKVSDVLTKKECLASAARSMRTDSCYSTADKMGEEIFEKAKSLTSSIVHGKERSSILTKEAITTAVVIQRKTFADSEISVSSIHFVQKLEDTSAYLDATDKSRDAIRVQVISSIEEPSKDESAHEVSSLYPEKRDFQDVAVAIATTNDVKKEEKEREKKEEKERKKEEEKLSKEISLIDEDVSADFQDTAVTATVVKEDKKEEKEKKERKEDKIFVRTVPDKVVPAVSQDIADTVRTAVKNDRRKEKKEKRKEIDIPLLDKDIVDKKKVDKKKIDTVVDFSIIDSTQKLKKDSKQIKDFVCLKEEAVSVINDIIDSFIDTSRVDQECMEIVKDILQELVSFKYKIPKYRSIDASYLSCKPSGSLIERNYFITKKEKMLQCKKIRHVKDLGISTCTFLSFTSSEVTRRSYYERSAANICQDDRSKLPRILQPIRCDGDLTPSNVYLGEPKCCAIRTTSYFNPQIAVRQDTTLSDVLCPSRAIGYHVSCRSSIDNRNASFRHCNINCCAKRRAIFENSFYTICDTRCAIDTKYCYPRLNNIDNVRIGYYHCNDNCPVWNNNRPSRSYHWWTRGNLYFTHPWTSRHLLRYN